MKQEFKSLSDWIEDENWAYEVVPVHNVKEAIKRLKEQIKRSDYWTWKELYLVINQIFGDKLT